MLGAERRLLDGMGKPLKVSANTAASKASGIVTGFNAYEADAILTQAAAGAVESMYEMASKDLF